jgi:hypothetical protein
MAVACALLDGIGDKPSLGGEPHELQANQIIAANRWRRLLLGSGVERGSRPFACILSLSAVNRTSDVVTRSLNE